MSGKIDDKEPVASIGGLLNSVGGTKNSITGIYIDETLSEFYQLKSEITIPHLPVKEIDLKSSYDIASMLVPLIPEYMEGHSFLEKRKPQSEQHSLHFIRPVEGRVIDFVHIMRFDFMFSGRRGRIVSKGDTDKYPSYASDIVYFKSQLVPVYRGSGAAEINSVRLKESFEVETDRRLFTSVIFDEYSTREISIELSRRAGAGIFGIPLKIYPFINYEYFTACLSIPDPTSARIIASARIFEPLFLYIYFSYRAPDDIINIEQAAGFGDTLNLRGDGVALSPGFLLDLKDYFSSYTLVTDDDLLLKGWKRFSIN